MRMDAVHSTFHAQEVLFGAGAVARLGELCARDGYRRVMLCTTAHSRARGYVAPIEAALGEHLLVTYEHVLPHVPELQVAEAAALAAEHQVDAIIGLGGGSSIGTAKAVSRAWEARRRKSPAPARASTRWPTASKPCTRSRATRSPPRQRWPAYAPLRARCRAVTPLATTWRRAPRCWLAPSWPARRSPVWRWGCTTAFAISWAERPARRMATPTASCCPM